MSCGGGGFVFWLISLKLIKPFIWPYNPTNQPTQAAPKAEHVFSEHLHDRNLLSCWTRFVYSNILTIQQDLLDSSNCISSVNMKIYGCLILNLILSCLALLVFMTQWSWTKNGFFAYLICFKSDTRREEGLRGWGGRHSRLDISGDSCTNHQHHRCAGRMSGGQTHVT